MALAKAEILQMVKKLVSPPKLGKYSLLSEPYSTDQKKPNSERERVQNGYRTGTRTRTERVQNGYRMDIERMSNGYGTVTKEKAFSIKEPVLQNTC